LYKKPFVLARQIIQRHYS